MFYTNENTRSRPKWCIQHVKLIISMFSTFNVCCLEVWTHFCLLRRVLRELCGNYNIPFSQKVRSTRPEVLCKKGVLRNLAKFTGKHLCQSLCLRPATLLKKRLWHSCFPANFAKFLRTPFLTEYLRRLLLKSINNL